MAGEADAEERLTSPRQADFGEALDALRDWNGGMPPPAIFYGLSDLDAGRLARYEPVWQGLPAGRRAGLLRHLTDAGESNLDLDYREPGMLALRDRSAAVRQAAIELLWEDDSRALLQQLLRLLREDDALAVRSAAAGALGRFVLAGELGRLAADEYQALLAALEAIWRDGRADPDLRRSVLESLSNSGTDLLPAAINEAWNSDAEEMRASALYAMGRSCDPRWEEQVLNALDDDDAALRFEAVRASGELELVAALPALGRLLQQDDEEIGQAAIHALGEIGGPRAQNMLEALAEEAQDSGDEALLAWIEDALGAAGLERFGRDQDAGDWFPSADSSRA